MLSQSEALLCRGLDPELSDRFQEVVHTVTLFGKQILTPGKTAGRRARDVQTDEEVLE